MKTHVLSLAVAAGCAVPSVALAATVDLPRHPALSPDGRTVVFSWRGDLWKAPAAGGAATRLTANPSNETRSAFTPDGARIVFESDREGSRNLWVMDADGANLKQLTEIDAAIGLASVGMLGGKSVAFVDTTIEGDLFRAPRPYVVSLDGGMPVRLHDAFGSAANASADGSKVLFERGASSWARRGYNGPDNRNVWEWEPATGRFRQLTRYDGNDGLPRFVGADEFVYISDRGTGSMNLFRARTGESVDSGRRLTAFDGEDIHGLAVSLDGRTAVFGVLGDLWRLDLSDASAKPQKLAFTAAEDGLADREFRQVGRDVSEVALSPDGKTMAFVANGDVFVRAVEDKSPTRRVTEGEARERDIAWGADGLALFFASDRDGSDSLYFATVAETRADVKKKGEPEKKPEPKPETEKPAAPAAEAPKTDPAAPAPAAPAPEAPKSVSDDDAKGEKKEEKKDPSLDPARWADAVRFEVKPLTSGPDDDRRPVPSPDGSFLLFARNLGDLARLDLATGEVKVIHEGWDDEFEFVFSPDGRLVALAQSDQDFNKDIWVLAADGSKPAVNVTRHPDNDGNPRFSADGKILAFLSERNNEETDGWIVMLDRDLEGMSSRDLDQYFKDAAEANKKRKPAEPKRILEPSADAAANGGDAKTPEQKLEQKPDAAKPAKDPFEGLELDDAYLRVRRVTTLLGNEESLELLPTGDRLVFTGSEGKDSALYSIKFDGSEQKKLGPAVRVVGLNFAGDRVVAIGAGQGQTIGLAGDPKTVDITATSEISLAARNRQKLDEISRIMGRKFYVDPKEKGLDWPALTARYAELASRARTADEFDFIANMFIGHLDASHLGVRSPEPGSGGAGTRGGMSSSPRAQGRLGVATEPAEGGRKVVAVLRDSPAALANPKLEVGDVIVSIDFEPVDPAKPLEMLLSGKIGQETVVAFRRAAKTEGAAPEERSSIIVPMSSGTERALRYTAETLDNARKVEQLSSGRIGYLHIQAMDQASLDRFERDLYAAAHGKEALIVDVRNNGGGFTADRLLSSIDVTPHAYAIPREGDRARTTSYPQDRLYIQRYTMPMAMLCNEKSFSNAEITSHAFKSIKRGPLIGQQTAGGVISTGSESLVDGTTVRMPFRGWYVQDTGKDMEENGAMPDIVVPQTPEDESRAFDAQLERAVKELLEDLPRR
ncbi:MAG: S41 family peptidase [Planctomycetaceae bacterium]|nr:S41 family peptidase [Planctomycetaceae bacterium]